MICIVTSCVSCTSPYLADQTRDDIQVEMDVDESRTRDANIGNQVERRQIVHNLLCNDIGLALHSGDELHGDGTLVCRGRVLLSFETTKIEKMHASVPTTMPGSTFTPGYAAEMAASKCLVRSSTMSTEYFESSRLFDVSYKKGSQKEEETTI